MIDGLLIYVSSGKTPYKIFKDIEVCRFFAVTPGNGDDELVSKRFDTIDELIEAIENNEADFEDV